MRRGAGMMQRYYRIVCILVLGLGLLFVGHLPSADAVMMLHLESGSTSITVTDEGAGDSSSGIGIITYNGSVGSFSINVTTGVSKPILGTPYSAELDLNSVNLSGPAGSIIISVSDDSFALLPPPIGVATTSVGGTTAGTVKVETFLDPGNTLFAETTSLTGGSPLTFGGPSFSTDVSTLVALPTPPGSPFSLTQKVTITHPAKAGIYVSSFDSFVSVTTPEPGTLVLLGTGLLGFVGYGWRRRKVQKI